jgi:coproporphyrinogen III oxidase
VSGTREAESMKIENFVGEMKERARQELLKVSAGGECTTKTYEFKVGTAEIITIRGGAIEKAAVSHLKLKGVPVPGTDKTMDGTVYQMEVFPENPYCPMGHFNTEWTISGTTTYHMNLDLFPAVRVEEDLAMMRRAVDHVADRFGRDREKMREGLDIHYHMDHWSSPLATKVGCKLLQLEEKDVDLFIAAYRTFFDAYLDILRRRKGNPFSEEEKRRKLERNGKWLEYIAFKDRAIKMAQNAGIVNEVLINLSFPPSAVF